MRPKQEGAGLNAGTRFGPLDRKSRQPYVDSASLCASQAADKPLRKAKGRILHNCREIGYHHRSARPSINGLVEVPPCCGTSG